MRSTREAALWCGRFEEQCRLRRIRITAQRVAVFRALAENTAHPSVDSVYARVHPEMPSLSLATVYRILEALELEGFIRRVSTPDGAIRFDANLTSHQHLYCRVCGQMTDFEEESLTRLRVPLTRTAGFAAEQLDIRIIGTCKGCRRTSVTRKVGTKLIKNRLGRHHASPQT